MGLVTVLYVFVKVSLFLPQWVEVRAFSILIVFSALSFKVLICSLNVSLGSKVSPSILGLRIVGSRVLSSCSDSSSLYSAGSGVKSVVIVLLALSFINIIIIIMLLLLLSTPLNQRAARRVQHPNHVAANSLSPQVARKGSTLSGFVQRSRLEREVGRDLHSNKWEEV